MFVKDKELGTLLNSPSKGRFEVILVKLGLRKLWCGTAINDSKVIGESLKTGISA